MERSPKRAWNKLLDYAGRLGIEAEAKFTQIRKETIDKELALAE